MNKILSISVLTQLVCVIISILFWLQWAHQHNYYDRRAQICPDNGVIVFGTRNSPELWQDVMQYSQIKSTSTCTYLEAKPKLQLMTLQKNHESTTLVCKCGWMFMTEYVSVVYICFNPQRSLILTGLFVKQITKKSTVQVFLNVSQFEDNMVKPTNTKWQLLSTGITASSEEESIKLNLLQAQLLFSASHYRADC